MQRLTRATHWTSSSLDQQLTTLQMYSIESLELFAPYGVLPGM